MEYISNKELKELADKNRKSRIAQIEKRIRDYFHNAYQDCKEDLENDRKDHDLLAFPKDYEPIDLVSDNVILEVQDYLDNSYLVTLLSELQYLHTADDSDFMYEIEHEYDFRDCNS